MSSLSILSFSPLPSLTTRKFGGISAFKPSASFALNTSSMSTGCRLLHCSPLSTSTSFGSSFSGSSLGLDSSFGINVTKKRGHGLVVKAGKYALSQTKRSRSRKSLARVHGFRKRMSTTSGRAVLKRRRAMGRWVLCSKSNPSSGKRS